MEEVGRACGAGTGCGGCRPRIGRLLARVEAETDTPPSLIAVAALSYRLAS